MTKALVIYHSQFGNTEKIAQTIALKMKEQGIDVDCIKVEETQLDKLTEYDFLAIGGPTHGFGMSKPMKEFFEKLNSVNLQNMNAFAFDTKNRSRFWGSAAKGIEKRLKKRGLNIIKSASSAIVKGLKGPLQEGMIEKFERIGTELADNLHKAN
ncbi:MAG: flavodoxin domain-containing protein [Candidatus Bathyarchaeota archaeon]|nr:MAG: flavodoxin domain-containing protein [Candidatus Bathyarchaeota archaeon]